MSKNSFIYGSIFMVFMNFLMRIIGFTYDVYLSKLLGAEAMGLFQISMSTLMTFLILTTSGIPTSVTKLVAEENSKRNYNNVEKIFKYSFGLNFILSICITGILIIFAPLIAEKMLKNKDMLIGVYFMAPAIIILSLSPLLRSYFYGMKNMVTASIAQIIEHVSRFIIVAAILYFLHPVEPIKGAIIAILGISIGEFCDFIWSLYSKRRLYKGNRENYTPDNQKGLSLLFKIIYLSIPLTISGSFGVILRFINTILIPNRLIAAGYSSSEAIATFGRIMGMAFPLISLSFIVTSALVINLIPSLSEKKVTKRYKEMKRDIQLSFKATFLVSFPLMAIYITLSNTLAIVLYNDPLVSNFIYIMSFGAVLMAMDHTFSGVLLGLNKQINATVNNLIGMVVRIILIYFLVGNPEFGINGFFIAFYISNLISLGLDILTLKSVIKLNMNYVDIIGKPLVASIFMILCINLSTFSLNNFESPNSLTLISNILVGFIAYILVLMVTKAIPKNFFKKLIRFH